jgi:hypothetical protein
MNNFFACCREHKHHHKKKKRKEYATLESTGSGPTVYKRDYPSLEPASGASGYKRDYLPLEPLPGSIPAPATYKREYSPPGAAAGGLPCFKEEPAERPSAAGRLPGGVKREYAEAMEATSGADYYSSGSGSSPQPPPPKVIKNRQQ